MGVYIPNMSKPKSCYNHCLEGFIANEEIGCPLNDYIESHQYKNAIHPNCPLIEIVECKDCKYWADDMSGNMWCEHAIGGLTEPTDFCSYGDRIDEYEKEYRELGLYELRELRKGERRADDVRHNEQQDF